MQITENLIFYPERGLFCLTDGKESCIAATGGYVTPLFVAALSSQLADKYQQLLKSKEWQIPPVKTTFVSFTEVCHFVSLSENELVQSYMSEEQKEVLDKLIRIYLQWVIDQEDEMVRINPSVWLEPAFYPIGVYAESEDFDPYNRYDSIPIGGFARSALYFFIANTAKNIIKSAIQEDNLLQAAKDMIVKCKAIFDDWDNVKFQSGTFRRLLDIYMDWRYKQAEAELAHDVSLSEDDIWQYIYNNEMHARDLFEKNMNAYRLYTLRPLLDLQVDLIERIKKDHPYISTSNKNIVPSNLPRENSYTELVRWLEDEKKDGRDHLADHDGNVEALCDDAIFRKKIGWYKIKANSLRTALRRQNTRK